jgi:hypothetical protein
MRFAPTRAAAAVAAAAVAIVVAACYGNKAHQRDHYDFQSLRTTARLVVVEADDRGGFWMGGQPERALDAVRETVAKGPTAVVLFIHGWGHNASTRDQNQVCFTRTLDYLSQRLNTGVPVVAVREAQARQQVTTRPDTTTFAVLGIYVGWRGRGLPEAPGPASVLTRAWTFWSRKATAERVGRGDLRSFIDALGGIYDSVQKARPPSEQERIPFNLVGVGHSFGGQVLYPAVASRLEDELQRAVGPNSWRALRNQQVSTPPDAFVRGFGDLVVIVNAAMESGAYERMHRLSRQLQFHRAQTPVLAVFSAENDWANKRLFPIGRFLSTAFHPTSEGDQRARERHALGRYAPQITHHLTLVRNEPISGRDTLRIDRAVPNPFAQSAKGCDLPVVKPNDVDSLEKAIKDDALNTDPTAAWTINGKRLTPITDPRQPNAALVVVQSRSTDIIDNHNGFFRPEFVDFLVRYVGDIQLKRIKTTQQRAVLAR